MTLKTFITLLSLSLVTLHPQISNSRPVSTYSIVAYDEAGVADVPSHPAVYMSENVRCDFL